MQSPFFKLSTLPERPCATSMNVSAKIFLPYPPERVGCEARYGTVGLDEVYGTGKEECKEEVPAPCSTHLEGIERPNDAVRIEIEGATVVS